MTRLWPLTCAVVGGLLLAAPAQAEITAQDAWAELRQYAAHYGGVMTADLQSKGNGLIASNISVTFDVKPGIITQLTLGSITFSEQPDGSVALAYPAFQTITVSDTGGPAEDELVLKVQRSDMLVHVAGTPGDVTYTTTAKTLHVKLDQTPSPGTEQEPQAVAFEFLSQGLSAVTQVTSAQGVKIINASHHDTLEFELLSRSTPDESVSMSGFATDAVTRYHTQSAQADIQWSEITTALRDGLSLGVSIEADRYDLKATIDEPDDAPFSFAATFDSFQTGYDVTMLGWQYRTRGENLVFDLEDPVTIPAQFTTDAFELDVRIPMLKSDAVQDLTANMSVSNLALSDTYWSILDPQAAFPRGTVSAKLASSIGLRVLQGYFDQLQTPTEPKWKVENLRIDELSVETLGATLLGNGAFTFDPDQDDVTDVFQSSVGQVEFSLSGAHQLIDTLQETGGLTDSEALQARAGLGVLTVPTDDANTLRSVLEYNGATGEVTANGVRIR